MKKTKEKKRLADSFFFFFDLFAFCLSLTKVEVIGIQGHLKKIYLRTATRKMFRNIQQKMYN